VIRQAFVGADLVLLPVWADYLTAWRNAGSSWPSLGHSPTDVFSVSIPIVVWLARSPGRSEGAWRPVGGRLAALTRRPPDALLRVGSATRARGGPEETPPPPHERLTDLSGTHIPGRKIPTIRDILDVLHLRRRRRPTAAELMRMDRFEFRAFIRTTGLEARITRALSDSNHDAP